jgi:hypothetical protein
MKLSFHGADQNMTGSRQLGDGPIHTFCTILTMVTETGRSATGDRTQSVKHTPYT